MEQPLLWPPCESRSCHSRPHALQLCLQSVLYSWNRLSDFQGYPFASQLSFYLASVFLTEEGRSGISCHYQSQPFPRVP